MESETQVQILDESACISLQAKAHTKKHKYIAILPTARSK